LTHVESHYALTTWKPQSASTRSVRDKITQRDVLHVKPARKLTMKHSNGSKMNHQQLELLPTMQEKIYSTSTPPMLSGRGL
jgi:hypothetical protein